MSETPEPEKKPIPREFHSEYEERPFRACSQCGEPLSAFQHYQINKAWRNGECVFEYVFCEVCRDRMLEEFSEESKANLLRHQEQHLRDVHGTGECAFCGRTRAESPMRDYVITALCSGDGLLDSLMICERCQLQTHELLSEKTRDVRRRFFEDLPGVPPGLGRLADARGRAGIGRWFGGRSAVGAYQIAFCDREVHARSRRTDDLRRIDLVEGNAATTA